jgi:D-alanyl-D-alanine carboxypeptidase
VWTLNAELLMNRDALTMLQAWFAFAKDEGYDLFRVTEGFRTHARQTELYASASDPSRVALPGHSEHQSGLAADISYHGVNIGNSPQGTWLTETAHRFGFILRYPQGREHITGIPYEPWHYRYVGQPHAYLCHAMNMVLEEYLVFLRLNPIFSVEYENIAYAVYYLIEGDVLELPEEIEFTVSRDNRGGVIIVIVVI